MFGGIGCFLPVRLTAIAVIHSDGFTEWIAAFFHCERERNVVV